MSAIGSRFLASGGFALADWAVVVGYLVFSTWLGARMAGKQATMRDFFLGGRKLPWYAVSGSIIATEISAVTFVVVPYLVFKPGGNFVYLQFGLIGALLARLIVAYLLLPAYYEREIYSPYDYMHGKLGSGVRGMTTALFSLTAVLGQSSRVYLTAIVLGVVMNDELSWLSEHVGFSPLVWAVAILTVVAIAWTLIGGITTVIWTDVLLFLLFFVGALVALGVIIAALPGGAGEMLRVGWAAKESGDWGKFTFFETDIGWPTVLTEPYTLVSAIIAATWFNLPVLGTDQLFVQRMFCCKGPREARRALLSSLGGQIVTFTVAFIGVGLYAYYQNHPMTGESAVLYEKQNNRIFPIFIVHSGAIPVGVRGLIIAAIFAAAISSLTSVLAALSQTTLSALGMIDQDAGETSDAAHRAAVRWGRVWIVLWGLTLCTMAVLAQYASGKYGSILDLALAMMSYAGGALLAGFFLAFLPLRITGRGYLWAAPLSVLFVFAAVWHAPWSTVVCGVGGLLLILSWFATRPPLSLFASPPTVLPRRLQTVALMGAVAVMIVLNLYGYWGEPVRDAMGITRYKTIAWPWCVPLGSLVAFAMGWALSTQRPS